MNTILHPRDLAGVPRSKLHTGFGSYAGAGRGGPRLWVGQPLIISCPVITWQTVLVSQAGLPTVSAVEQLSRVSQRVELPMLGCPLIPRFLSSQSIIQVARTLQRTTGEDHTKKSDVISERQ